MVINKIFILIMFLCFSFPSYAAENVFYVLHYGNNAKAGLNNLLTNIDRHANAIQIIISQAYTIHTNGNVTGYMNEELISLTKKRNIKLMAMITNADFDAETAHQFLLSSRAQTQAIKQIITLAKENHLYGVQFDFEMISIKDREALTNFYRLAAEQLHVANLKVSFAIIPAFLGKNNSAFLKKSYQNLSGAYDLTALGKSADFVTIMAYNQHADGTTPGPLAGIKWVEEAIQQTQQSIPKNKISLGVPAYSIYWYTGKASSNSTRITTQRLEIGYKTAMQMIKNNHADIVWDKYNKNNYSVYDKNWLNEYVYLEDADSLKYRMKLADKYKLRGISVFRMGTEDKKIWKDLA